MQADLPFFEGPEDALRAAIQSLGGSKKVGQMIWPDKTVDQASRQLHDAINPNRPEKLDISQIIYVLRHAKEIGCHSPFIWFANECGYDANPVNKEIVVDRLTSVIESSSKILANAMEQLARVQVVK